MFSNMFTIAQRTITQMLRDPRTLVLIIIVPLVIASLFGVSIPDKMILKVLFHFKWVNPPYYSLAYQ
jgi:hypothetical protein